MSVALSSQKAIATIAPNAPLPGASPNLTAVKGVIMPVNFKQAGTGNNSMMLECPVCHWYGEVWYNTKPPAQCSNACKQKAKRQRKKGESEAEERALRWKGVIDGRLSVDRLSKKQIAWVAECISSQAFRFDRTWFDNKEERVIVACAANILHDLASYLVDLSEAESTPENVSR